MQPEQILEMASKVAEQAEVYYVQSESTPISFEANRLKQVTTRESRGVALRIIKNGRVGLAATTRLDEVRQLVDAAVEVAQFGAEAKFDLPGPGHYPAVNVYDPSVEQVTVEKMVDLGNETIERLLAVNSELLCEASISKSAASVQLLNSKGGKASYRKAVMGISMEATLIRGTDMLFVGDSQSSCQPILDVTQAVNTTLKQLEMAKRNAGIASKAMPVIFVPQGVLSALISPLASAFNGKTVLLGASPLGDKRGQRVFDSKISIWDDPTIDLRPGSAMCDDEGIPTRKVTLVNEGVVGEFLYDLQTAGLAGTKSTGSAGRSLESLPSPSTSLLVVGTGNMSQDEMIADVKEGLLVWHLMGAGQGNVLGGDFSGNVLLGYKIENGQVVGRVKDTMVAGNVYDVLKDVVALGSEAEWLGGSMFVPAIYVASLGVASRG
ncbi:MAG: TldD/PmbA family protein [Chloroflexi bacterium]|nr:TldD/PmbA family protein [Chloroflexota bacterium]